MGFTEIYERIKLATNCRTQVELAELLNIRQSSISDAKRRDSVPGDWYMKLFEHFGLNPDWLKYGVGPLYLRTDKGYCPQEAPQALAKTVACYGDDFTGFFCCPFADCCHSISVQSQYCCHGSAFRIGLLHIDTTHPDDPEQIRQLHHTSGSQRPIFSQA